MKNIIYSLLIVMIVSLNTYAAEEKTEAPKTQKEKDALVVKKAIELLDGILSPQQYAELNILSYSVVVASYCDGIGIDKAKYEEGLNELNPPNWDKMSESEKKFFIDHFMFNYGITVGMYLHEGAQNLEEFCSDARKRMKDEKFNYWVEKTDTESK